MSTHIEDRRNAPYFDPDYLLAGKPGKFKNQGRLKESPEFSPGQLAPLGIPGNPLDGVPMAQDAKRPSKWWERGTRAPLQSPGRLETSGLTGVGGVPAATQLPQHPEQLLVPDVVSATDPAFSATPQAQRVLDGLGRLPAASPVGDSPWSQYVSKSPKYLKKQEIFNALNMGTKGLDLPYEQQGNSNITRV